MTRALVAKLLRDLRVPLLVVALLLLGFECLWAKITQRITEELVPQVTRYMPLPSLARTLFEGPGKVMQTLMGGESINFARALDMLTIGYVHPLVVTILCVWAIGRASVAIAGEIDRGTMELLLAEPIARYRVILAHLCVDLVTIPVLCLALWGGNWLGVAAFGKIEPGAARASAELHVDPVVFRPALASVGALLFAVSGYTMWLSARGRFRGRVLGVAVLVTLVQFLVNVIGQLWPAVAPLRPFTVFYYYQPQPIILQDNWLMNVSLPWSGGTYLVNGVVVLGAVGVAGYGLALWTFCRRDLPAPL
jgi:ABC-2 type transport system permease protein